jgi:radical SAM superfamily enzyme YgiQ (UPF0313 family)
MSGKPKLLIVVLFQNLAEEGRTYYARSPSPPLSGALLAALTPPIVEVELLHEMVRPIDYRTDAEIVALSFMDYCAPHAFQVAARFRALGKKVIAGGRFASTFPSRALPHFDAVVAGEAETVWPRVVEDAVAGRLEKLYQAPRSPALDGLPPPRYDLVEPAFSIPVVTEATRGCIYRCSYCQLTIAPTTYRKRPIEDVLRDLTATEGLPLLKRKMAMLYDNNLGGDLSYAKELLGRIAELRLWGIGVQFSFDCLHDDEFIERLAAANCRMAFIGMESLHEPSLHAVHKRQNRVEEYAVLFGRLRRRGILVFAGLMVGLEEDTPSYYDRLPGLLDEVDPSAVLTSIAIPIPGTPFHRSVEEQGRIEDVDLAHHEGDHLVFRPRRMTRDGLLAAYVALNRRFYSWRSVLARLARFVRSQRRDQSFWPWVLGLLLTLVIYFKLSLFQRHHAATKVYPLVRKNARGAAAREPADTAARASR